MEKTLEYWVKSLRIHQFEKQYRASRNRMSLYKRERVYEKMHRCATFQLCPRFDMERLGSRGQNREIPRILFNLIIFVEQYLR